MDRITLEQANMICLTALAKGAELALKPLTVAVLDAGGHIIALQRQDGASTLRPQIACAKAGGALGLGISSRKIGDMALERPTFIASLGPIAPSTSGLLLITRATTFASGALATDRAGASTKIASVQRLGF